MGNKSSKKHISLKEDINKNDQTKNLTIPQVSTKNISTSSPLENSLKEKENNIIQKIKMMI